MKEIYINCSCGGGASVKIGHSDRTAVTECACGKVLMASEGADNWRVVSEDSGVLKISVGDDSQSNDVFGG